MPKKSHFIKSLIGFYKVCKHPHLDPYGGCLYKLTIKIYHAAFLIDVFPHHHVLCMHVGTGIRFLLLYQCIVNLTWFLFISISVLLFIRGAVERKGACLTLPDRYWGIVGIKLYHPGPGDV